MRVHRNWPIIALALVAAIAGCAKKQEQATMTTTNDSLVAANPQEQGQGSMTPQATPPPAATPAPAPAPERSTPPPVRHHTTTHHRSSGGGGSVASNEGRDRGEAAGTTVPSGTSVSVSVNTQISSETAQVGDSWTGVVKDAVMVDGRTVIPAGSTVTGTVTQAASAARGSRASLDLAISSINVEGHTYNVHGGTEAIVAGSTRARNIGAVVGGAGAGALIGKAVGGGKGALIGGLLGGAAAGGAVAKSKGYQVVIKDGTTLTFTTSENVSIRS